MYAIYQCFFVVRIEMQADEARRKNVVVVLEGDPRFGAVSVAGAVTSLPDHLHRIFSGGGVDSVGAKDGSGGPAAPPAKQVAARWRRHIPITSYAQPQLMQLAVSQIATVRLATICRLNSPIDCGSGPAHRVWFCMCVCWRGHA